MLKKAIYKLFFVEELQVFHSFPRGPLPGRQNIVVTRNAHYRPQGVTVAHSIDQAIALVGTDIYNLLVKGYNEK